MVATSRCFPRCESCRQEPRLNGCATRENPLVCFEGERGAGDLQRRARLHGVGVEDKFLRRPRTAEAATTEHPLNPGQQEQEHAQEQEQEQQWQQQLRSVERRPVVCEERWYAGCATIPPGSYAAAAQRFGGVGAARVAVRNAGPCARSARCAARSDRERSS